MNTSLRNVVFVSDWCKNTNRNYVMTDMPTRRAVLRSTLIIIVLFLSTCVFIMKSMSQEKLALQTSTSLQLLTHDAQRIHDLETLNREYRLEIETLKHQLDELRGENHPDLAAAGPIISCEKYMDYDRKLNRTELIRGHHYKSESLVPVFTKFTLWHHYPVIKGYGGRVMEKLIGNKKVRMSP